MDREALDQTNLGRVELVTPAGDIDVTSRVRRTMRPDIAARFQRAAVNPAGFLLLMRMLTWLDNISGCVCAAAMVAGN